MNQGRVRQSDGRKLPPLVYFWGFLAVVFIGILIYAWIEADRANPVILNEHGRPRGSEAAR